MSLKFLNDDFLQFNKKSVHMEPYVGRNHPLYRENEQVQLLRD